MSFFSFYPPPGSSVLAAGAATSANQLLEIAALNSIDTKLTSPVAVTGPLTDTQLRASAVPVSMAAVPTGAATAAKQDTGNTSLASIDAKLTNPLPVSVAALPLPTGAATEAKQDTGNTSVASIDTKTPALGQALAAASVPVVLTAAQLSTLTPLTSVAVTGPLTDTQLRATPVPVSGTVSTGGLTDTQLRATPVPVSGTVTANAGTNLNTSALNLETTQTAMSAKLPATLGQKTMAASMAVTIASDQSTITASVPGKTVGTAPVYTDYSSTPVTTSAYVQLVASTGAAITHVSIFDGSGQAMIIATGAAASEVIKLYVPPGGGEFDLAIPAGTRIAIKALTASATSSYQLLNMLS